MTNVTVTDLEEQSSKLHIMRFAADLVQVIDEGCSRKAKLMVVGGEEERERELRGVADDEARSVGFIYRNEPVLEQINACFLGEA